MRRSVRLGAGLFGIVSASWIGFPAIAVQPAPSQPVLFVLTPSTQQPLQPLPEVSQKDLQQELQMRKLVQEEVDRKPQMTIRGQQAIYFSHL